MLSFPHHSHDVVNRSKRAPLAGSACYRAPRTRTTAPASCTHSLLFWAHASTPRHTLAGSKLGTKDHEGSTRCSSLRPCGAAGSCFCFCGRRSLGARKLPQPCQEPRAMRTCRSNDELVSARLLGCVLFTVVCQLNGRARARAQWTAPPSQDLRPRQRSVDARER